MYCVGLKLISAFPAVFHIIPLCHPVIVTHTNLIPDCGSLKHGPDRRIFSDDGIIVRLYRARGIVKLHEKS